MYRIGVSASGEAVETASEIVCSACDGGVAVGGSIALPAPNRAVIAARLVVRTAADYRSVGSCGVILSPTYGRINPAGGVAKTSAYGGDLTAGGVLFAP